MTTGSTRPGAASLRGSPDTHQETHTPPKVPEQRGKFLYFWLRTENNWDETKRGMALPPPVVCFGGGGLFSTYNHPLEGLSLEMDPPGLPCCFCCVCCGSRTVVLAVALTDPPSSPSLHPQALMVRLTINTGGSWCPISWCPIQWWTRPHHMQQGRAPVPSP